MTDLSTRKWLAGKLHAAGVGRASALLGGTFAVVSIAFAEVQSVAGSGGEGVLAGQPRPSLWMGVLAGVCCFALAVWRLRRTTRRWQETEASLRRNQELLRGVLDELADGVIVSDANGQVLCANRVYQAVHRESEGATKAQPAPESALGRVLRGETIIAEVGLYAHPVESGVCEVQISGRTLTGAGGTRIGALVFERDVTAQRRAERELQESAARHRQMVSAIAEGVVLRDRNGDVIAFNENAARILGFPGGDLAQMKVLPEGWRMIDAAGRTIPASEYPSMRALSTGRRQAAVQCGIVSPSAETRWVSMNAEPIFEGTTPRPAAVVTTFSDISEQKRTSEELETRRRELEEAQRLARVGSWSWTAAGDVRTWSPEMYRMTGRPLAGVPPSTAERAGMYTPESWQRLREVSARALRNGEPFELDLELVHADGGKVSVVARGEAERDAEGTVTGLRGTLQDVTAWRQAEYALRDAKEAAEQATKSKGEFLAEMSHEIRTPMNAIVGMTSLLLQSEITNEQRDCLETVRTSSEALLAVVNDILDFSKIEAGKLVMERIPFDIERMVEEAIDVVADAASQKGLQLQFFVSSELPPVVLGDSLRLRQILLNLLSNAIKFTAQGSVTLLVEPAGDDRLAGVGVRFAVSDTGSGLTDAEQHRLFQHFTQAGASTSREYGGTGLGLSISKRLAELMGGAVGVHSLKGEGSTFWFTASLGFCPVSLPAPVPHEALEGKRILVIGNQPIGLLLIRQQVESLGMVMTTVHGESDACAAVEREMPLGQEFAACLVDADIAGTDAVPMARRLRARSAAPRLPLIFAASVRDQALMTEAAGLGSAEYLLKPLRKSSLMRALCRLAGPVDGVAADSRPQLAPIPVDVLVAEDNLTNQKVTAMMLQRIGCRADIVGNGKEVIAAMGKKHYDVVLMDCEMPVLDGWATTAAIREMERGRERTPILALTANALEGDRERCLAAGMDDYLSKPLSLLQLHAQLARWAADARLAAASSGKPAAEDIG